MKKYMNGQSYLDNNEGIGLDDYMDHVGATYGNNNLSNKINNQINEVLNSLLAVNDPLSNEILTNKEDVTICYSKLQELVPLMKVDMTSALGVLITYQDNDGD
jgi:predicted lipoprotein